MVKDMYGCKLLMQPGAHQYDYFIAYTNTEGTIEQETVTYFCYIMYMQWRQQDNVQKYCNKLIF